MKNSVPCVFDLHCDTPRNIQQNKYNHVRPERLRSQSYVGAVFAHFVLPRSRFPFVEAIKMLSSTISYISKKKHISVVTARAQITPAQLNIILGVEGGHIFDNTFKQVEALYDLGVRVFTITWNNSNKLASSALDNDSKGLTRKGKRFIRMMKDYDIIFDLSHASTRTVLDVCELGGNRVIASHSCVRRYRPKFARNIDDRAIQAIVDCRGVIGVNFSRYHLGTGSIADHIDYLVEKHGIDAAAIGSDFDGITDAVITSPAGLKDLAQALYERGYKDVDVEKIFSKNFLRVFSIT